MKNILSFISILVSVGLYAQKAEEPKSSDKKKNKIETIKIINGDTVMHDVRIISGDMERETHKMQVYMHSEVENDNMEDDIEEMLENMDIYINLDDRKKRVIIHKMEMYDDDFDSFIEEWEDGNDMIIDMRSGKNQMKIIKIKIDDDDGEEVKVIEIRKEDRRVREDYEEERRERRANRPDPMKVFPNPAEDEINLEFEVMEGKPAELTITDVNGKRIFSKSYNKPGTVKEKIKLKEDQKGMVVIRLLDQNRTISKSIIIE